MADITITLVYFWCYLILSFPVNHCNRRLTELVDSGGNRSKPFLNDNKEFYCSGTNQVPTIMYKSYCALLNYKPRIMPSTSDLMFLPFTQSVPTVMNAAVQNLCVRKPVIILVHSASGLSTSSRVYFIISFTEVEMSAASFVR